MIDFETIKRDNPIPNIAAGLVQLKPAGMGWMGICPFHSDRSPSFTIFAGGQRFHCFGCGASGDVLDFLQRAYGVELGEAVRMLGLGDVPKVALKTDSELRRSEKRETEQAARAVWDRASPAAKSVAEAYLRWRNLPPPYPSDLRFLALSCDEQGALPCLIAAVRDVAGEVIGIQRIWLTADGLGKAAVAKPKRSLGRVKGGAIRLGELDDSGVLTVCEGPEDGLSLCHMLGGPVWVAAGATMLPGMQFPSEIHSIVIGADNDPAGEKAAREAAQAFVARGLTVRIIRPLAGFKDFNDELRGAQA